MEMAMADLPYNVLFLCTGNSARSIMAEAILQKIGAGKFCAYSAGSHPKGTIHPEAFRLLKSLDYNPFNFRSKSSSEFVGPDVPKIDFVFTVCDNAAAEVCPVWPGQPVTAHWGVPDPAAVQGAPAEIGAAFAETYRMLERRIGLFMNLPLAALDKLSLQRRLDAIGHRR